MTWGAAAPAAITGLVTVFRAGLTVPVRDGATVSDSAALKAVSVAYQTEDQDAVTGVVDPAVHAADLDHSTVNCAVHVAQGRDLPGARAQAFTLFGQAGQIIKNDTTLGNAVMRAWVSSYALTSEQSRGGPVVVILFGVDYEAYTTE